MFSMFSVSLKMRTWFAIAAAALFLASCAPGAAPTTEPGTGARNHRATIRVQVREGTALVVRTVPLESYVAATALTEVHPDLTDEALAEPLFELQSVVARTYVLANRGRHAAEGFDVCSTTHCQLYEPSRMQTSRWAAIARDAAQKTAGTLIWFADGPAHVVFHADCGGHTSTGAAVWGGVSPPYLAAARDGGHEGGANSTWTFETRVAELRTALNADPRTSVGSTLDRIEIAGRDVAGRAEMITLRGTRTFIVRGEVLREIVARTFGARSLRSTLFSVKRVGDRFTFSGKGFGHGVGLCQAGALARLRAGATPEQVLAHYFPGTSLRQ
jgi:stage II sporulation protein D